MLSLSVKLEEGIEDMNGCYEKAWGDLFFRLVILGIMISAKRKCGAYWTMEIYAVENEETIHCF